MSLPEIQIKAGDVVGNRFIVKKKLGEGACGQVWLVNQKANEKLSYAMKVEPRMKKEEEVLKMEIFVLKKLQHSKYFCRFFLAGFAGNYTFCIMQLLGTEVTEMRRKLKDRKFSQPTTLRIGLQAVQAAEEMHKAGFIHRDLKPSNMAFGKVTTHVIFIFDFGLARQILLPDKNGKLILRPPRNKVSFRGTVRYCSLNVHQAKEQGRHDDLWSVLFTLVECLTGTLPWKGCSRKDAERIKRDTKEDKLFKGCPNSFGAFYKELQKYTYTTVPAYCSIRLALSADFKQFNLKMTAPWEWEEKAAAAAGTGGGRKEPTIIKDTKREADNDPDNDTKKDVEVSGTIQSSDGTTDGDYDAENTLDNIAEVENEPKKK